MSIVSPGIALLFLTMLFCAGMYFLPASVLGYKIKRVDLLSDFKVEEKALSLDSLRLMLEEPDTIQVDSALIRDSLQRVAGIDSAMLALRDSLYQTLYAVREADSLGKRVEDYSLGHIGLRHFFSAIKQGETLGRPVRVAFLGDSFIEGDILVADLRAALQQVFGGEGVGFVPVNSVAAKVPLQPTALLRRGFSCSRRKHISNQYSEILRHSFDGDFVSIRTVWTKEYCVGENAQLRRLELHFLGENSHFWREKCEFVSKTIRARGSLSGIFILENAVFPGGRFIFCSDSVVSLERILDSYHRMIRVEEAFG